MFWSIYEKKSGEGVAMFECAEKVSLKEGIEKSGGRIEDGLAIWGPENSFGIAFRLEELGMEEM